MTVKPWWDRDAFASKLPFLQARMKVIAAIRAYFTERGFYEVETPALQVSPGLEPHLRAFRTMLEEPQEQGAEPLYLHTSPEFAMKKLLVAGVPRLFQIAKVFRNGERSDLHHPEFSMLEWYRAGEPYESLMEDCRALLQACLSAAGGTAFRRGAAWCDPFGPWEQITVQDIFLRETGIDPLGLLNDLAGFKAAAQTIGVTPGPNDAWDDVFFRIFLDRIEPKLGQGRPTLLTEYPITMAALARPKPGDERVAERFELYVCGVELANAFGELTDAAEQSRRFQADMDLKAALYGERYPIDADFLAALECGLPESSGIALGVDRLVMLATDAATIDDVLWAPVASNPGSA